MKKIKYLFTGILAVGLLASCLKDYQELNTNPDVFGEADPVNVFTGATRNFNNCSRGHLTGKYGTMVFMQYLVGNGGGSEGNYVSPSRANNHPAPSAPWYSDYYQTNGDGYAGFGLRLNYLINNVIPIEANPEQYNDLSAIARILLVYKQWMILDTYGAAPITEAFQAVSGNYAPRYDLYQESIDGEPMYKVFDAKLKEAVATLKASDDSQRNLGNNDFFYTGDVEKWIKVANTIRVKMAQRLEKRDNTFYNEVVNDVLASAANVMSSNDDSFIYWHPADYNNNTDDIDALTYSYIASAAFVNYLKEYNDPRLPILIRKNGFGDGNNNTYNDDWFDTFIETYPDYKVGRKIDSDSVTLDLNLFTERYIGVSSNPAETGKTLGTIMYGKNLSAIPYMNDGVPSTMDMRLYSQFESRYFVKQGGKQSSTSMPIRDIEDMSRFLLTDDNIHMFTPILTYPEACFMFAEIAFKKGGSVAGKDATTWYRDGIRASIEQTRDWAERVYVVPLTSELSDFKVTITDSDIAAYLAQPEFQSATLEKIISQQWVNLFMQPEEMWATWKRTGLPAFKAAEHIEFNFVPTAEKPTTSNKFTLSLGPKPVDGVAFFEEIKTDSNVDLIIPRRNILGTPNSLNVDNYNVAVEKLKADPQYGSDVNTTEGRIWWDKE